MANPQGLSFERFSTSIPAIPSAPALGPMKRTQTPVTTGTSVLGIRYEGGIVLAADTLASYGSLLRYRDCTRLHKVNDNTVIACMGDYADFQYLLSIIEQKAITEDCMDDGFNITARSLHSWLTRVLYNKRCKFDPLWTTFLVAGTDEDDDGQKKEFLGYVDKLGTAYTDPVIATGYGSMLATPVMREAVEAKTKNGGQLTEQDAIDIIKNCMTILYYRDARAHYRYEIAVVPTTGKARIEPPTEIKGDWQVAHLIKGYE
ncbi:Proteasome subunit beta type-4 [Orchesella cincta]|uniref:Proteasome subunit beta n=1 Tax=Orchesella cincta TaxID=48709 RepID=A0A1D2MRL8_ORCCI|nr:Proteasome subunit beta type-4 [Orchesella cincta]